MSSNGNSNSAEPKRSQPGEVGRGRSPRRSHGHATLDDVAKVVGVSAITVSRALRSPHLVAEATRERIQTAVDELGYIRNHVAGSLASTRTHTCAAIIPTLNNSIFAEVLHGMIEVLRPEGYQLVVGDSGYDPERERSLVEAFLARQVDGLMLTGGNHTERTRKLLRTTGVPVVETWSLPERPIMMSVGFSNYHAAYQMVTHLHEWGYRTPAFVSAPTEANDRASERRRGFLEAVEAHGMRSDPRTVLTSPFGLAHGREALARIVALDLGVDVIFFANDTLAAGALFECQRRGLQVPKDIAIAGFDDLEIASQVVPALTTVRVPRFELGLRAAQLISEAIEKQTSVSRSVDLGFEIVRRESA